MSKNSGTCKTWAIAYKNGRVMQTSAKLVSVSLSAVGRFQQNNCLIYPETKHIPVVVH